MKILVTGGAGYIGSILTPALLKAGHEVVVLDNFMYQQNSLLDCCHDPKLAIVRGDARDRDLIGRLLKDADAVFPLACLTGAPLCQQRPEEAQEILLDAVKLILDLRGKDQIVIFPTTNSGYGIGEKGKFCTEETPLKPISLYGKLKVEAEAAILQAGNGITLRLATAFGVSPRMRLDLLVNDFTYQAVTAGKIELFESHFMRNFIHVRDIAAGFIHSLNHFEEMKNEPYNMGLSDANLSKMELCLEIKKFVPEFKIIESKEGKDPDKRDYIVSNEKIEKTGFHPRVSLQEGIRELIKGYQVINDRQSLTVALTNVEN